MTEAADRVTAALERHAASVRSARETASALADQRERETESAAAVRMGNVPPPTQTDESRPR